MALQVWLTRSCPLSFRAVARGSVVRSLTSKASDNAKKLEQLLHQDREWLKTDGKAALQSFLQATLPTESPHQHKDLDAYVRWRVSGLPVEHREKCTSDQAVRALSKLLSFPLTLGHAMQSAVPYTHEHKDNISVAIVGARAESSLPIMWWRELLVAFPKTKSITIRFLGPGLQWNSSLGREKKLHVDHNSSRLELISDMSVDSSALHDHSQLMPILFHTDIFTLFNPGLGSELLSEQWLPTMRLLMDTHKPIVCTAHGENDLQCDLQQLAQLSEEEDTQALGAAIEVMHQPERNPFACKISSVHEKPTKSDSGEKEMQIITANEYWYAFRGN